MNAPLIELADVEKVDRTGRVEYRALRGVDLTIARGEMVAVVGPSGSGKSTVLNMITGIDRPTSDTATAAEMFDLLRRLNGERSTILYVTHDRELAARAQRTVTIRDGVVA